MTTTHQTTQRNATPRSHGFLRHCLGTVACGVMALTLGAAFTATPATAFWSQDNIQPFDPDVNPPYPYDPTAVGRLGAPGFGGWSSDCYWSREQTFVAGRLVWRPLQVCPYAPN